MDTKHTKGQWEVEGLSIYVKGEDTQISESRHQIGMSTEELRANLQLMAAAPMLLEALQECVYHLGNACAYYSGMPQEANDAWRKADTAISFANDKTNEKHDEL